MGDHAEQHGVHFDPATMQMFQAFAIFMQQQHATERREISATKAIQAVVKKMDQFVGKDVTKPKEGLSITKLLREFERCYAQLTRMEKATLDAEKTELFLQAEGKEFQEKLELLLEDKDVEEGLKTNWNEVEDAVPLLAKR
ncbi:hypothetical protein L7F22_044714 [Adiantum nelumboides]|nr:hypothetical protein [Adiantum nelumboides]